MLIKDRLPNRFCAKKQPFGITNFDLNDVSGYGEGSVGDFVTMTPIEN